MNRVRDVTGSSNPGSILNSQRSQFTAHTQNHISAGLAESKVRICKVGLGLLLITLRIDWTM